MKPNQGGVVGQAQAACQTCGACLLFVELTGLQQPMSIIKRTDAEGWFRPALDLGGGDMDESSVLDYPELPGDRIGGRPCTGTCFLGFG